MGAIAVAACAAAAGAYGTPPVTHYVLVYSGPDGAWEVERGTQRLAPANGLPLRLGDCVVLRIARGPAGAAPQMTVIAEGREIVVNVDRPRYCVAKEPQRNPIAAAIARTFASLATVFHDAEQAYDGHSAAPMTTRGVGPHRPALPLLAGDSQRLASGTRSLAVVWTSGAPPYSVTLTRAGSAQPLAMAQTPLFRARLDPVMFSPGSYQITVTDAALLAREQRFIVVAASAIPAAAPDVAMVLGDDDVSADLRAAYDAARLMADPSDDWRLEAYQRVVDHGHGSALAQRLIYELETGR